MYVLFRNITILRGLLPLVIFMYMDPFVLQIKMVLQYRMKGMILVLILTNTDRAYKTGTGYDDNIRKVKYY